MVCYRSKFEAILKLEVITEYFTVHILYKKEHCITYKLIIIKTELIRFITKNMPPANAMPFLPCTCTNKMHCLEL